MKTAKSSRNYGHSPKTREKICGCLRINRRLFGCGIFIPHKSIGTTKSED